MANKERAETEISLAGKKYKLRPTFEALCEIEDKAGVGIPGLVLQFRDKKVGYKQISAIIFGGLFGAGNSSLSFEEIGKLVMDEGINKFVLPCGLFIVGAMNPPVDESAPGNEEPKAET